MDRVAAIGIALLRISECLLRWLETLNDRW
jgi:hypothetical protein